MSDIKVFKNSEFGSVRTVEINNEPWFVGKDVAEMLGYENTQKAIRDHVDDEDKKMGERNVTPSIKDSLGREQYPIFINESGLYSLVLSSKLPNAKAFKRWITTEVIPTIRKHGAYMTAEKVEEALLNPDVLIKLATELKQEREQRIMAQAQIEADRPKVIFADAVAASQTSILVGEMAKLLRQNGVQIGRDRLFEWLRNNGYLIKKGSDRNMPTQRSMENKWFEIKETTINNPDGSIRISKTPKITGLGQTHLVNKFLAETAVHC